MISRLLFETAKQTNIIQTQTYLYFSALVCADIFMNKTHSKNVLIFFKGIRLKGNAVIYAEVEQRVTFYADIAKKNVYMISAAALFPFLRVAFDLCLGKYTIDSWIFVIAFW